MLWAQNRYTTKLTLGAHVVIEADLVSVGGIIHFRGPNRRGTAMEQEKIYI